MRVIAGKARRLSLKTPKGMETRPTQDRIKETLFNMLQPEIPGCIFLDLFSGSGGIGIEALSRGANQVYFVEKSPAVCAIIQENLEFTHLKEGAFIIKQDAFTALKTMRAPARPFDIIFMDPPYNKKYEYEILKILKDCPLLTDSSTLIVTEASLETDFFYLEKMGYQLIKEKNYKTNKHLFIQKK